MQMDSTLIVLLTECAFLVASICVAYGMIRAKVSSLEEKNKNLEKEIDLKADKEDHVRVEKHLDRHVEAGQALSLI